MAPASIVRAAKRPGELVGNQLLPAGANLCSSGFTNRYDAANYQTAVPFYDFQGQDDPTISPGQSMYHYLTRANARTSYIAIGNYGHQPFLDSPLAAGCGAAIWNAIASASPIAPLVAACGVPYAAVERGPGQPPLP